MNTKILYFVTIVLILSELTYKDHINFYELLIFYLTVREFGNVIMTRSWMVPFRRVGHVLFCGLNLFPSRWSKITTTHPTTTTTVSPYVGHIYVMYKVQLVRWEHIYKLKLVQFHPVHAATYGKPKGSKFQLHYFYFLLAVHYF